MLATVVERSTVDGSESEIKLTEEMTLKLVNGKLKIVRLVGIVIPTENNK